MSMKKETSVYVIQFLYNFVIFSVFFMNVKDKLHFIMAFLDINKTVTTKAPDYLMMVSAGVIKYGEERLLATVPAIGNGTLRSAAVKGVLGIVAKEMLGGFWGNAAALGFTTDAVEDALYSLMGANPAQTNGNAAVFGINAGSSSAAILPGAI